MDQRRIPTIRRQEVRVLLDCEAVVKDISMAAVRKKYEIRRQKSIELSIDLGLSPGAPDETPSEEEVEDQRLLLAALLAHRDALKAWLEHDCAVVLDAYGVERLDGWDQSGKETEILMPVIDTLPLAQRHKFRHALAEENLWEVAGEFYDSFTFDVMDVEICALGEGHASLFLKGSRFHQESQITERHRVRIVFEYDVQIRDISLAAIQARDKRWRRKQHALGSSSVGSLKLPSEEEVEDIRLLQESLCATPDALKAWLEEEVASLLDEYGITDADRWKYARDDREILQSVIEALPPRPRARFSRALAEQGLVDELYYSFRFQLQDVQIDLVEEEGSGHREPMSAS